MRKRDSSGNQPGLGGEKVKGGVRKPFPACYHARAR